MTRIPEQPVPDLTIELSLDPETGTADLSLDLDSTWRHLDLRRAAGAEPGDVATASELLQRMGVEQVQLDTPTLPYARQRPPDGMSFGRFVVSGELGKGGSAVVYEAHDGELKRPVALKLLTRADDRNKLKRFVGEAQITSQLSHPGIVPVHELGVSPEGQLFYVMKRVAGRSLGELLERLRRGDPELSRQWDRRRLLTVLVSVCQTVAYAHSRGVLHRDLKPSNIMLGEYGEVLVMDWGVARLFAAAAPGAQPQRVEMEPTRIGSLLGTPGYMSPEQTLGLFDELDGRSDVWSLGAILYATLAWAPPYPGDMGERLAGPLQGPPVDPRERAPERRIPDELAAICLKAMSSDRDSRHQSALELAQSLESYLSGRERRTQSRAELDQARGLLREGERLRGRADVLAEEAAALLADVPDWAPEKEKWPAWTREQQAQELLQDAAAQFEEALEAARGALIAWPENPAAHELLADWYRERHEEAEQEGDASEAARLEVLLRSHDQGTHRPYLAGLGSYTLYTDPPDARVALYRYEEQRRKLVALPLEGSRPRPTPIRERELPIGSYLAVIHAEGHQAVRYPLRIERLGHWSGLPPAGGAVPPPIRLPPQGSLLPDEIYVPGGWFEAGGDPLAAGAWEGARVWVDGFLMQRFPVTNGDYLRFLNDLLRQGRTREAEEWAPREAGARQSSYPRDRASGLFSLDSEGRGRWQEDWPVVLVSWRGAVSYARWLARRTGLAWRLPRELEWEKAARGVDGRPYPWGHYLDPSWCCMDRSHRGRALPAGLSGFAHDLSPYGVRGMAGNVRDWCVDPWTPGAPPRVQQAPPEYESLQRARSGARVVRGGSWRGSANEARVAGRASALAGRGDVVTGFRLVRSLG